MADPATAAARREALKQVYAQARVCERCSHLAESRTQVVFGAGSADADVLFVGEAPGADEDAQGVPFVGRAGRLLTELLSGIGLAREDVFIANVLKCRPPENRNPTPAEIASCSPWLFQQLELIQPTVVVTLGNFATKLLRDDPTGITQLRGRAEIRAIGPRVVRLLPVLHPAAALYTPSNREVLAADFALLPDLIALGAPAQDLAGPAESAGDPQDGVEPTLEDLRDAWAPPEHPPADGAAHADVPEPADPPEPDAPQAGGPTAPGPPAPDTQLGLF